MPLNDPWAWLHVAGAFAAVFAVMAAAAAVGRAVEALWEAACRWRRRRIRTRP